MTKQEQELKVFNEITRYNEAMQEAIKNNKVIGPIIREHQERIKLIETFEIKEV
jgi:hypothetical protein